MELICVYSCVVRAKKISLPKVSVCNFILSVCELIYLGFVLSLICFSPHLLSQLYLFFSAFSPFQRADIFHFAAATSSRMEFQPVHLEIKMRRMGMMSVAAMRKMRRKIVMRVLSMMLVVVMRMKELSGLPPCKTWEKGSNGRLQKLFFIIIIVAIIIVVVKDGTGVGLFGHFWYILAFLSHLVPCLTKKTMQRRCLCGFQNWKARMLGPKTAIFAPQKCIFGQI